jgi:hypothetical protein
VTQDGYEETEPVQESQEAPQEGQRGASPRMDRRQRRALMRSVNARRQRSGGRLAPAALYTHTIFVDPQGNKHRVANDKLDAFVLRHARPKS